LLALSSEHVGFDGIVMAGLDPAIPIIWHGCASLSGIAGSIPAMTAADFCHPNTI
jgi:hypothetical protein